MQDLSKETFPSPVKHHPAWQILDATKLEVMQRCWREYFFEHVLGLVASEPNHDLIFGDSIHVGMKSLYKYGMSKDSAALAYATFLARYRQFYSPMQDQSIGYKTPGGAESMFYSYIQQYGWERYKLIAAEICDSVRLSESEKVYFRLDAIVQFLQDALTRGKYTVLEHKTAKDQYSFWDKQWLTKTQPRLYGHALAGLLGPDKSYGVMVNGLFFQKEPKFRRVAVAIDLPMLRAWVQETLTWIDMLYQQFELLSQTKTSDSEMHAFPKNPSGCVRYMHMCHFCDICSSRPNPLQRADQIPIGLKVRFWDPRSIESEDKKTAADLTGRISVPKRNTVALVHIAGKGQWHDLFPITDWRLEGRRQKYYGKLT